MCIGCTLMWRSFNIRADLIRCKEGMTSPSLFNTPAFLLQPHYAVAVSSSLRRKLPVNLHTESKELPSAKCSALHVSQQIGLNGNNNHAWIKLWAKDTEDKINPQAFHMCAIMGAKNTFLSLHTLNFQMAPFQEHHHALFYGVYWY